MLTGTLRIGTEFFLNRTETREGITHHFRLMRDTELTLVGIFIVWDDIEHTPGTWNFERYDWIYDAAASQGISIVATLCSENPPGWTRQGVVAGLLAINSSASLEMAQLVTRGGLK
jgi:hypothetical protein